jgi:Xaa-Pro dipeptidase
MPQTRIQRLQGELRRREIDCLAVVPGPNLFYLTGVDFHLMERPTVGFIPAEGSPIFALPVLEVNKLQAGLTYEAETFAYSDNDGPQAAFRDAMMALPEVHRLAIEDLKMRLLEFKLLRQHVPAAEVVPAEPVMSALRAIKSEDEIAYMRRAIGITERALQQTVAAVLPGMSERAIANRLMIELLQAGGGMLPFQPIVLNGPNSALPHGVPGERVLQRGEIMLIDFGTTSEGYVSDITRTFIVGGEPQPRLREIYEIVQAANEAGREAAKPGVPCQEIDRAARKVIDDAGYGSYFIHRTGHGIGLEGHEEPYMVEGNEQLLEPGMTFTVEPGIYIPDFGGVRIEDDVVITEDGSESLTTFDRALQVVGA